MVYDTEVQTKAELELGMRRKFSNADNQRLRAKYDNLPHGRKSAWLRRQRLHTSQIVGWRQTLQAQARQRRA